MTDEEIESVRVPLPWYRNALRQMREEKQKIMMMADVVANSEFGVVNDIEGEIHEWRQGTEFVDVGRGGGLEITPGKLVFFPTTGGVWIDTLFCEKIDPKLVLSYRIGHGTRTDYMVMCKKRIEAMLPPDPFEGRKLFTIQRM